MDPPQKVIERLIENNTFKKWEKVHQNSFLSHFFYALSPKFEQKSNPEMGYFDADTDKITVFLQQGEDFVIKLEDDVFKKKNSHVEKLALKDVKITFVRALEIFKENLSRLFPHEIIGDGFLILQTYQGKTLWNFTFISKTLKFLNVKINAETGKVEEHQAVSVVQQEK